MALETPTHLNGKCHEKFPDFFSTLPWFQVPVTCSRCRHEIVNGCQSATILKEEQGKTRGHSGKIGHQWEMKSSNAREYLLVVGLPEAEWASFFPLQP